MIIETSSFPDSNKRIFYGLKENGRYYFKNDDNEEIPFFSLNADSETEQKYESGNSIFIFKEKEYFLSMGRFTSYTEIFDFENKKILGKKTSELIRYKSFNIKPILLNTNKSRNQYILPLIADVDNVKSAVFLKFEIVMENSIKLTMNNSKERVKKYTFGEITSCFVTEGNEIIICFYGYKKSSTINYCFTSYNQSMTELATEIYDISRVNEEAYFFCIYFREEAGAFIYYKYLNDQSNFLYPFIFFKKYNKQNNTFEDYFSENNSIFLDKYVFDYYYTINDFLKISDTKLGFFSE